MKIINRGNPDYAKPWWTRYIWLCDACMTTFQPDEGDPVKMHSDFHGQEGNWAETPCPVCERRVTVSEEVEEGIT